MIPMENRWPADAQVIHQFSCGGIKWTDTHVTHKKKLKMFSLGTLLMALSGRRTLTVRMADRLIFCRSSEYSTILEKVDKREQIRNDRRQIGEEENIV